MAEAAVYLNELSCLSCVLPLVSLASLVRMIMHNASEPINAEITISGGDSVTLHNYSLSSLSPPTS